MDSFVISLCNANLFSNFVLNFFFNKEVVHPLIKILGSTTDIWSSVLLFMYCILEDF